MNDTVAHNVLDINSFNSKIFDCDLKVGTSTG